MFSSIKYNKMFCYLSGASFLVRENNASHKLIKICSLIFILAIVFCLSEVKGQTNIYLIPGQGADERLFSKIEFPAEYDVHHIEYKLPLKSETMEAYAARLAEQIDTTEEFILIGVSLGGMLSTEIAEFTCPEKVIVISSAKSSDELPKRYSFQKKFPLYKLVGPRLAKVGAQVLQPVVEPDRKKEKAIFKAMLAEKDPLYYDRMIEMIIEWKRKSTNPEIIHIHGTKDHTIPIRNVSYDYVVEDGSHMITLTRPVEVSSILKDILCEE